MAAALTPSSWILSGEVSLEGTRGKVGLKNTHNRLTLLYGEAYGLRIHSAPGEERLWKLSFLWIGKENQMKYKVIVRMTRDVIRKGCI